MRVNVELKGCDELLMHLPDAQIALRRGPRTRTHATELGLFDQDTLLRGFNHLPGTPPRTRVLIPPGQPNSEVPAANQASAEVLLHSVATAWFQRAYPPALAGGLHLGSRDIYGSPLKHNLTSCPTICGECGAYFTNHGLSLEIRNLLHYSSCTDGNSSGGHWYQTLQRWRGETREN